VQIIPKSGARLIKYHSKEIKIFKPQPLFFEQSSDDIWQSVCECIREITKSIDKSKIKGIGFDATCSLVLIDENLNPLTVSPTHSNEQNVIMWLDHRAEAEAEFINSLNHECLKYVGGKVSLEMEVPKLLWLKKNLQKSFEKIHFAFDLPDFLTWMASGDDSRSICSLTCKWNFDAVKNEFPSDYFDSIGLNELIENNFAKIGNKIKFPGDFVGKLSEKAATEMNLPLGISIGSSLIDAHAGALGLIGSSSVELSEISLTEKLVMIAGTSTCHMSITDEILFAKNIWGPYKHALVPNYYLSEGGQSASGILIDHILQTHPDYEKIVTSVGVENLHNHLFDEILKMSENLSNFHELTRNFHIYADFHGNRSPMADPTLKGMICGLTMHDSIYVSYLAVIQALAYSTRHIIETLYAAKREHFKCILMCGGLSKNKLFVQTNADVCKLPVLISNEPESVLLGAAMLGANAVSGSDLKETIEEFKNEANLISPNEKTFSYHEKKYQVYLKMLEDQISYRQMMGN
jgi:FGGY-family pentulose kinase